MDLGVVKSILGIVLARLRAVGVVYNIPEGMSLEGVVDPTGTVLLLRLVCPSQETRTANLNMQEIMDAVAGNEASSSLVGKIRGLLSPYETSSAVAWDTGQDLIKNFATTNQWGRRRVPDGPPQPGASKTMMLALGLDYLRHQAYLVERGLTPRHDPKGAQPEVYGRRGQQFRGDLSDVDLRYATLAGATFIDCRVDRADFSFAELYEARFGYASLKQTSFASANLTSADFRGATLNGANFRGACLRNAVLLGARFGGADFADADISGVFWRGKLPASVVPAEVTPPKVEQVLAMPTRRKIIPYRKEGDNE